MHHERREHSRREVMAQIRVKRGRTTYIMHVKNISISGMLVESENIRKMPWFRVGQELEMDIFTTEELDNLRLKGNVVRVIESEESVKDGFGVAFDPPDADTLGKLKEMVEGSEKKSVRPPPLPEQNQKNIAEKT